MQFLSENRLNGCQNFGQFGFSKNQIRTEFWFCSQPYKIACSYWLHSYFDCTEHTSCLLVLILVTAQYHYHQ